MVVLAAALWSSSSSWLCSPPPVGSVSMLARAGGTEHDRTPGAKHEGHTGTSNSAPRFCSEHQNNVNQTSAFGPWLLFFYRNSPNTALHVMPFFPHSYGVDWELLFKISVATLACSSDANWYSLLTVCQITGSQSFSRIHSATSR